ncbi:MAG: hypothetical protein ACRYG6_01410 [Janthinobacterium lividum]
MDVLLSVRKTCCCCGAQSTQPIYADAAAFTDNTAALDGSTVAGQLNRGMQVCPDCGYAAPSLDMGPRGMTPAGLRAAMAAAPYRQSLQRRDGTGADHEAAMRWHAYAAAFEDALSPERAGLAWVNAAAELEQPRLHRLGSTVAYAQPDLEQAHAARRKAIGHLGRVFEAEFGPASGRTMLPALRRAMRRRRIGEPAFRPMRWSAEGHVVTDTAPHMRFELACTLADLLRRTGEFVAARTIALRALHTGEAPDHLAATLSFQLRLCSEGATGLFRRCDLVGTVVAFPAPVAHEAVPADVVAFGRAALAAAAA